jgi:hypothetical protein
MHQILSDYLSRIEEIVREGQQKGEISREVDAGTISLIFLGVIQPAAILSDASGKTFDLMTHVQKAWPIFVRAILPAAAARPRSENKTQEKRRRKES